MRTKWLTLIVLICSSIANAAEPAPPPTTAPAPLDDCSQVIAFPIPAGTPDATSHALVVVPHPYKHADTKRYPVVYLLHGYGAHHLRYHEKMAEFGKSLTDLADRFGVILVMPDGKPSSWYFDAPTDVPNSADWQYETIITKRVLPEIDARFRTWADRAGRGITGISMGGHGAIYLSARNPDLFAAASSMSGIMDLRETTNPAAMAERIGPFEQNRNRWMDFSCVNLADKFVGQDVALLFDCGWDDPFIWSNRAIHHKLMLLGVAHDFIERPGKHEWKYWINALPYHLQFLTDHLKTAGD